MTGPIAAYAQTWGEVGASFISAAVSVALVSVVWFTLAPLFGLTTAGKALHSHWSRSNEACVSLVESFPSVACASNLMP